MVKYSAGLWTFGQLSDRFSVYSGAAGLKEKFSRASRVQGLEGLEIIYPSEFTRDDLDVLKALLKDHGFEVSSLLVNLFSDPKWKFGAFISQDEGLRREALELTKECMEVSKEVGSNLVNLWLGQDGYDYLFQVDYAKAWDLLIDSIKDCALHIPDVKLSLEYKLREPRTHSLIATVGKAVLIANEIGLDNVGVTIDIGHAFNAYENPAESLILARKWNRLFHIHMNDNFREWDDDMIVGSQNFWDYIEFFYYLKEVGYDGWLSLDVYPYRDDPVSVCSQSIANLKKLQELVSRIDPQSLKERMLSNDQPSIIKLLWDAIF
ncbi:MAG: sugar phosphate isomerase/epimerase family protein [Candidatus Bathyarchaeia archaeon]|nr:sugar phosphate isomerase/epimerase [Candidatus Bathyarchaeota archaeon]